MEILFSVCLYIFVPAVCFGGEDGVRGEVLAPADPEPPPAAEVLDPAIVALLATNAVASVVDTGTEETPEEQPDRPHAVITADGKVYPGCWLSLDAATSKNPDPETEGLRYEWRQSAGPPLALLPEQLSQSKLWLFLMEPGEYRIALRARNAKGWSNPAAVKFTAKPGAPESSIDEGRKTVGAGERVELPFGRWKQVAGPPVDLRRDAEKVYFRPAQSGLLIFEMPRPNDTPARRGIFVPPGPDGVFGDRRPFAVLPKQLSATVNHALNIDASRSYDPDAEETAKLQAHWSTPDKQRGVELEPLPGLSARFKASRPGTYSVMLTVSDGRLESQLETAFVEVSAEGTLGRAGLYDGADWDSSIDLAANDNRYRSVSLRVLNSSLDRAVQLFPSRCGTALRVDSEVALPEQLGQIPLSLEVVDGPLLHLLDWTARQTGANYRKEREEAFWLTRPLSWLANEKLEPTVVLIDALYAKTDASDLLNDLRACFKPVLQACPNASMNFESSRQELVAVLPAPACARLKELAAALREPEGLGLPPPSRPGGGEARLRRMMAEIHVSFDETRLRLDYMLRKFSENTGICAAFDPRQFPGGMPFVALKIDDAPVREVVRELVEAAGFDGCSVEAPAGLWFYKGARPYPSNELLWDHAVVRVYDLSGMLPKISPLSGVAVAYAVRRRVYQDSWNDPGAAVFFHEPTKKLLVMHGPAAQRKVLEFLHDLVERGAWALGPAEEMPDDNKSPKSNVQSPKNLASPGFGP